MKTIIVTKADEGPTGEPVESLHVIFDRPTPDFGGVSGLSGEDRDMSAAIDRAYYVAEAERVEAAINDTIPAALYDQILFRMLARTASHHTAANQSIEIVQAETQREKELERRNKLLADALDEYAFATERLERDLCGDNVHTTGQTLWDHIRAHTTTLGPIPSPDERAIDKLHWLENFRATLARVVDAAFPNRGARLEISFHYGVGLDEIRAALESGFKISRSSDDDRATAWLESADIGDGTITLFTNNHTARGVLDTRQTLTP